MSYRDIEITEKFADTMQRAYDLFPRRGTAEAVRLRRERSLEVLREDRNATREGV